ncbi:juxtaposed with another zinc finger protein 1 [Tribolium castaneum]|uniref:Juxtaposed with another zinc finger protein 1-like Protein n=1 Tax=Tribolium castaneum TaxID=7070 RepID=A0A139WB97_TRICA|nr:PREDICTED: juxtaposed with another zinc finger protein 1 [Tribolium castaneum]KYB25111.1 Juxtaposed with another zinc finger protein 1-like Protein [Tribolium castaneum]|eukprot:XP_008193033.1 PREDICTED: juxtaposed with another zinc finger protein 1 [Tribolium castaneum]
MALFYQNICPYSNCSSFESLTDLITHIEREHIDFHPHTVKRLEEEKPASLPFSYVLRFNSPDDPPPQMTPIKIEEDLNKAVIEELADERAPEMATPLNNNYLSVGFNPKEKKIKSEAKTTEEQVAHILWNSKLFNLDNNHKKPFGCNMKGCEKRYKNINGIKYHYKNHHKMLTPWLRKSVLRQKSVLNPPKTKICRQDVHGTSMYRVKPSRDIIYRTMAHFDGYKMIPNEYFYNLNTLPTSDVVSQVPLENNMSFNYNLGQVNGDNDVISGKNSNFFSNQF